MSWDFSTEPEFVERLCWMRNYVDEQLIPLELVSAGLNQRQLDALWAPFKDEVKRRGMWAPV